MARRWPVSVSNLSGSNTTGARHKRDIEGLGTQLKDITRQIETLVALLTEVEQRRPLLTKIDELEAKRVALATKLQATVRTGANDEAVDRPSPGRVGIPGRRRPDPNPELPRNNSG